MTVSFQIWELAVFIAALALVIVAVYLIRLLKDLSKTVENANNILEENRYEIHSLLNEADGIAKNTRGITDSANNLSTELEDTVVSIKSGLMGPVMGAVSAASTVKKMVSGVGQTDKQKIKMRKSKRANAKKRSKG